MANIISAKTFERARMKGAKSNKDSTNGADVKKEFQQVVKRGYRQALPRGRSVKF